MFDFEFAATAAAISDFQMILPVGVFKTAKYGELEITREMAHSIVENWTSKVMGERLPFIDTDHDQGAANGWIVELQARDDGVYARVDWTDLGRENVENKRYRYFSAMIAKHVNIQTGDEIWPVLKAVSLTNTPVMDNMPAVTLSDKGAHGDAGNHSREECMDFEALLKAFGELKASLTPEQTAKLSEALGVKKEPEPKPADTGTPAVTMSENAKDKVIIDLSERVDALQTQMSELKSKEAAKGEDAFIALALCDPKTQKGKIKPADEEFWRKQYRENPKAAVAILEKLPPILDFTERGTGSGGTEKRAFTEADRKRAKKFNPKMTDEQINKMLSDE
jgi:phage I-like protein